MTVSNHWPSIGRSLGNIARRKPARVALGHPADIGVTVYQLWLYHLRSDWVSTLGCQPACIPPTNRNLCKISVFRGQSTHSWKSFSDTLSFKSLPQLTTYGYVEVLLSTEHLQVYRGMTTNFIYNNLGLIQTPSAVKRVLRELRYWPKITWNIICLVLGILRI